jgi:hypothetical protein
MKKIYLILLITLSFAISSSLHTTRMENSPVELTQPDGTLIQAFITGHRTTGYVRYYRYHDEDGYTMIRDEQTRYYCWARQCPDGWLLSTGLPVHLHNPAELGISPGEDNSPSRRQEIWDRLVSENENTLSGLAPGNELPTQDSDVKVGFFKKSFEGLKRLFGR